MKTRLLLILTTLQFCSLIYAQEEIDPMRFFPSQVGNVWEYYENGLDRYLKLILTYDSLTESKSHMLYYNNDSVPRYIIDSNHNVYWNLLYNKYWLYYKLDADSGDTWIVEPGDSSRNTLYARVSKQYNSYVPWLNKETLLKEITYFYKSPPLDTAEIDSIIWDTFIETLALDIGSLQLYLIEQGPERTLSGCIIDGDTLGTLIAVKEESNLLNISYILSQNYPNPFNPNTKINYYLPVSGNIRLGVYNIIGQEIALLEEGYKHQGYHTIEFDGSSLPSGIYVYKLTTNEITLTKKMLLLK